MIRIALLLAENGGNALGSALQFFSSLCFVVGLNTVVSIAVMAYAQAVHLLAILSALQVRL